MGEARRAWPKTAGFRTWNFSDAGFRSNVISNVSNSGIHSSWQTSHSASISILVFPISASSGGVIVVLKKASCS